MKKLLICMLALALLLCMGALAEAYPESKHPYPNNSRETWTYTHPEDAYVLKITFSEETKFETGYDFLHITDAENSFQTYTGSELSGAAVFVPGNSFTLKLESDGSETDYGFAIESITGYSQEDFESGNTFSLSISEDGCITGYEGVTFDLVVPETLDGIQVTSIGDNALESPYFRSIELPDTITSIGNYAFAGCPIQEIKLPSALTRIGENAFSGCASLKRIDIPANVTEIGDYAFEGCASLTEAKLPDGLTYLGRLAFCACENLRRIEIPAGITRLSEGVFDSCFSLSEVILHEGLTAIDGCAFYDCKSLTSINLPSTVQIIEYSAFYRCKQLEQINLPDGLTHIGSTAFGKCSSLTSISIPDAVTTIESYAFTECSALSNVRLPAGISTIPEGLFDCCTSLTDIRIPDMVTSIQHYAFGNSGLTSIVLPEGLAEISGSAFENCARLANIKLPDALTSIGSYAFSNCSRLGSIQIPGNVNYLGHCAFEDCASLKTATICASLTAIESETFRGCANLSTVVLPYGLEQISSEAFAGCTALQRLQIPESVYAIDKSAIDAGTQLLVYSGSPAEIFALKNGYGYLVVDQSNPRVLGFNFIPAESSVGCELTWRVEFKGSASDMIAFELYRNNTFLLETEWENIDDCDASFSHTFALPGMYHAVAKVKAADGDIVDSLSGGRVHVRASGSADMEIFDAALNSPTETNSGSIVSWSFNMRGGAGNYDIIPNIIINGAGGQNSSCASISFETLDLGSHVLCKGSFIPTKGGEYGLSVLVLDDTGAATTADIFSGLQVNAAPAQIIGISGVDDDCRYYVNTADANLHLSLDLEGETDGLLYSWTLIREDYSDAIIVDQFITDAPETDYILLHDGDLTLDVRAYNPETMQYSDAYSISFVVYPMEDYNGSGEGFWGVYGDGCFYQAGDEVSWYASYDDGLPAEFRFVLYKDGVPCDESDWSVTDIYSAVLNEPGIYTLECSMRNQDGNIYGPSLSDAVAVVESLPDSIHGNYTYQYFTNSARNAYSWCIGFEANDWENTVCRFELYKDGEPCYSTDWISRDYEYDDIQFHYTFPDHGVYTAYVIIRDGEGNISSPIPFEPLDFSSPVLDNVTLSTYNSILNTGDMLSMNCSARYGAGNMHAQFSLFWEGNEIDRSPMIPMVIASDDARPMAEWHPTVFAPGEYYVSAVVVDETGSYSEVKTSSSILVVGETIDQPVLEYITASSETSIKNKSAYWAAVSYGGTGSREYQFTLYRDGELVQTYDWQTDNILSVNFPEAGYYYVTATARDEEGRMTETIQSPAISVSEKIHAESIFASANNIFTTGTGFTLDVFVLPEDASDPQLQFRSSNEAVATVSDTGDVEIVGEGSATITVSTGDGSSLQLQVHVTSGSASTLCLPASASEIRLEAFAGINPVVVDMSGHTYVSLADRAFAGCESLCCVLMPEDAEIGDGVFEGCDHVVLFCRSDAQADYALRAGIPFVHMN